MVNMKVEMEVGHLTPIVTSITRLETVVPGKLEFWALSDTTLKRLLLMSSK